MDSLFGLVVAGVVGLVLWIAIKSRGRRCPKCDRGRLEVVEWFRCNPPPDIAYYRCSACGAELVRIGKERLQDRIGSPHEHDPVWDPDFPDRHRGKPL